MSKNVLKSSAPLRVGTLGSDPASADNGTLFYNSSDGLLRMRENGQWQHIASRDYVDATTDLIQNFEWQPSVLAIEVDSAEIVSPAMGDRYLIAGVGLGAFSGHDNAIAQWDGTAWVFTPASVGMMVSVDAEADSLRLFDGASWSQKYFELTTAANGLVKNGFEISIASSAAGSALSFASGVFDVNVDSSTIEVNADSLRVKADGIDQTHILLDNNSYLRGQTSSGSAVDMIKVNASGALEMASFMLTPSSSPVGNYEVANKKFVDDQITSVNSSISALNLNALTDVVLASSGSGQLLRYDGSNWVNQSVASGASSAVITEIGYAWPETGSGGGDAFGISNDGGASQTFQEATYAGALSSIKVGMMRAQNGGAAGDKVSWELYAATAGVATGAALGETNQKDWSDLIPYASAAYRLEEFSFPSPIALTNGQEYIIVAKAVCAGSGASMVVQTVYSWDNFYPNGTAGGFYDLIFKLVLSGSVVNSDRIVRTNASGRLDSSFLQYNVNFGGNRLSGVATPTLASDAANKGYTDGLISSLSSTVAALNLDALTDVVISSASSGQILRNNGSLFVNETPIAVSSGSASADKMLKSNSAGRLDQTLLQYNIDFGGNRLSGVATPTQASDAANKSYTDGLISSLSSTVAALNLDALTDVVITSASSGQVLRYVNTSQASQALLILNDDSGILGSGMTITIGNVTIDEGTDWFVTEFDYAATVSSIISAINSAGGNVVASVYPSNPSSFIVQAAVAGVAGDSISISFGLPGKILVSGGATTLQYGIDGVVGWVNEAPSASAGAANKLIVTDGMGKIAQGFLQYNIDFGGNRLSGIASPSDASDAATKGYTDGLYSSLSSSVAAVNLDALTDVVISSASSGEILRNNGSLFVNEAPIAVSSGSASADKMLKSNSQGRLDQTLLQYNIDFGGNRLSGVATPTQASDAASKGYTDGLISSLSSTVAALNLDALTDVVMSSPSSGDLLRYDGSSWTKETPVSAASATVASYSLSRDSLGAVNNGSTYGQSAAIQSASNFSSGTAITWFKDSVTKVARLRFYISNGNLSATGTIKASILTRGGLNLIAHSSPVNLSSLSSTDVSTATTKAALAAFAVDFDFTGFTGTGYTVPANTDIFIVITATDATAVVKTIKITNDNYSAMGTENLATYAATSLRTVVDSYEQTTAASVANNKIVKTNASGFIDKSFLQYNIDFGGNRLSGVATPTQASDAASKGYTDGLISSLSSTVAALNLDALTDVVISSATSGQVLRHNGSSFVNEAPIAVSSGSASADKMLKSNSAGRLDKTLLQYNIDFGGNKLSGVSLPTDFSDVSNKGYVDQEIASITSSLSAFTLQGAYQQDADGGGAVITTNSVDGALEIAGTQKLLVSAAGGLDITGGEVDGGLVKNSTLGGMLYIKTATNGSVGGDIIIEAAAGSSQDGLVRLKADGTEIGIAGGGELRLGVNGSDYMSQVYKHIIVLSTGGSAVAVADLGFSATQFKGVEVSYSMHSNIGSRVGTLLITTDGSSTSIADSYTETADLSVVFSAAMDGTDVVVSVDNDSASAANMRALLKKFQA